MPDASVAEMARRLVSRHYPNHYPNDYPNHLPGPPSRGARRFVHVHCQKLPPFAWTRTIMGVVAGAMGSPYGYSEARVYRRIRLALLFALLFATNAAKQWRREGTS